jgi:predicted O-methyltransferase YrrM
MMRMKMISDDRTIKINDLGAGSTMMKTNNRRVSDIVRNSSVSKKYGILLSNLASEFGQPYILELGTSLGISALYMAKASSEVKVRSIEGCTSTSAIASEYFSWSNVSNIDLFTGSFDDMIPTVLSDGRKPGLVFIDGDHRKDNILRYFRLITESSDENTVIVIDDIYYSKEMELAWKEIKQFDKVTITVDLFRMGIVFFRKGMTRNDYIIRY